MKHIAVRNLLRTILCVAFASLFTSAFTGCYRKATSSNDGTDSETQSAAADGTDSTLESSTETHTDATAVDTEISTTPAPGTFVTLWKTDEAGVSEDNQIQLPLVDTGNYNFTVRWGDGTEDTISRWDAQEALHTYDAAGEYLVEISGAISGWRFVDEQNTTRSCTQNSDGIIGCADSSKLMSVIQWGDFSFGNNTAHFYGCTNLTVIAKDAPDLSATTSLEESFAHCYALFANDTGLRLWDTTNIKSMRGLFSDATMFNGDISRWNTRNVNDMSSVFSGAKSFNQSISQWRTSNVSSMSGMFDGAAEFNQNIGRWDTSMVTDMYEMFCGATSFNQDISEWNVSQVVDMADMFSYATSFDQNLGSWQMSNVDDVEGMFSGTHMSTANYDALLIGWASQNLQSHCEFQAGDATYSADAADARETLSREYNWEIFDGGMVIE